MGIFGGSRRAHLRNGGMQVLNTMMKTTILISILLLILVGCSQSESDRFEELLVLNLEENVVLEDFPSSTEDLISKYENRFQESLCDTSFQIAIELNISNGELVNVPFTISKKCIPYIPDLGMTEVLIKSEDQVRIDIEYVSTDSIKEKVYEFLNERLGQKQKVMIKLEFEWLPIGVDLAKKGVKDTFAGVEKFANEKSKEWFDKSLNQLSTDEFSQFKDRFKLLQTITETRPDLPNNKYGAQSWP
jgi:hypothetical protein